MTLFLEAHRPAPAQIILDLDATDDPLHGDQEGRFFTATMTVTAIFSSASFAVGICWRPGFGDRTSMPFGLARNTRLVAEPEPELARA